MKWEPADWIRLVALIGAFGLLLVGAWMIAQGVAAEGAVDIKSSVISGSLKTGSAGLFIAFFSFVIIVFVLTTMTRKPGTATPHAPEHSAFKRLLPVFWGLLIAVATSGAVAGLLEGAGRAAFGVLAAGLGVLLLIVTIALLTFLEND